MTHAAQNADAAVRSSRSFELTMPGFPSQEQPSQVYARVPASEQAPLSARHWVQEDPFPLLRPKDAEPAARPAPVVDVDIDVTFDDSLATRDTLPVAQSGAYPHVAPAPYRPQAHPTYEQAPESLAEPGVRRWPRGRMIAARVFATLVLLGVSALFAYEVRLILESGMRPF